MEATAVHIAFTLGLIVGTLGPYLLWLAITVPPGLMILPRISRSKWWALPLAIPLLGLVVFIWLVALMRWPQPLGTASLAE